MSNGHRQYIGPGTIHRANHIQPRPGHRAFQTLTPRKNFDAKL